MKRLLALLLALALVLGLTGCGEITVYVQPEGGLQEILTDGGTASSSTALPTEDEETDPSDPAEDPTDDTDPSSQPSDPTEDTTPATEPTDPTEKPTESTRPATQPTEPSENPTEPSEDTTEPSEDSTEATDPMEPTEPDDPVVLIDEDGWYYSAEDVGLYLHTYGHLPSNYITKTEAKALGWKSGSVEKYKEGGAIGGDKFGNREGLLPKASGRQYYECDIDTNGRSSRGSKRIVYSNDGLIYYTTDHYVSFTLLYGEEDV